MYSDQRKVEGCEPDDPCRCQAVHGTGQCRYKALEHSKYCSMHGGQGAQEAVRTLVRRQYALAKWQARVDEFADEDQVKSLRAEIGITRLLIETVLQKCKDSGELLLYSTKISELITKVERLVVSCHRLEANLGLVLDKSKVLSLAAQVVEIIGKHVKDDVAITSITNEIVNAIVGANKDG